METSLGSSVCSLATDMVDVCSQVSRTAAAGERQPAAVILVEYVAFRTREQQVVLAGMGLMPLHNYSGM